jgi:tryptophan halogenase
MLINHIIIAGGGSAGWMAAIAIASRYPALRITVIDPKAISPIGVGESVTGVVLSFVGDPVEDFYALLAAQSRRSAPPSCAQLAR